MSAPNDDLGAAIEALKQGRRDLAYAIAAEVAANPERGSPNMGAVSMLATTQGAIVAVAAVMAEDAGGGDEA